MSEFEVGDLVRLGERWHWPEDRGLCGQIVDINDDEPQPPIKIDIAGTEYRAYRAELELLSRDELLGVSPRPTSFEAALDYTLDEVRKVMIDRHKKYGPGNILRHGLMGVVVRLGDKYERLDNNRDQDFADESVDDTILDIVGYGLIARMLRAKAWPGQS